MAKYLIRTPWTSEESLNNSVFVLLREPLEISDDPSVLFYAVFGEQIGKRIPSHFQRLLRIDKDRLPRFLYKNSGKAFITFDAVEFHKTCLQAVPEDDRRAQNAVWKLSKQSRLWDVGILEQRLLFAYQGKIVQFSEISLQVLFHRWLETDFQELRPYRKVGLLKNILARQLDWAACNLPVGLQGFTNTEFSNNSYCSRIESKEHAFEEEMEAERLYDRGEERHLHPSEILILPFDQYQTNRRRNILFSSSNGPLGIGLDLQSALLAEALNKNHPAIDMGRLQDIARHLFDKSQQLIRDSQTGWKADLKNCLCWDVKKDEAVVKQDQKGFVDKKEKKLRKILTTRVVNVGRFRILPPLPWIERGKLSLRYADWMPFRNFDPLITTWMNIEASSYVLACLEKKEYPFQEYTSFPNLRSATEILAEKAAEALPSKQEMYVEVRFCDLELRTLLAHNVALYGLLPEMEGKYSKTEYPRSLYKYIINGIDKYIAEFEQSKKNDQVLEKVKNAWEPLSASQKRRIIDIFTKGLLFHETEVETSNRLREAEIPFEPSYIIPLKSLLWEFLVSCRRPKFTSYRVYGDHDHTDYRAPGVQIQRDESYGYLSTILKNELHLNEFLFHRALDQLCSKTGCNRSELKQNMKKIVATEESKHPPLWSIVDYLRNRGPRVWNELFPIEEPQDNQSPAQVLLQRLQNRSIINILNYVQNHHPNIIFMTNAVSSTGKVGSPIHYSYGTFADVCLFQKDLITQIAFELLTENKEVVLVSNRAILVRLRTSNEEVQRQTIEEIVKIKARKIFQATSITSSGFHFWLAEGTCKCRIVHI